MALGALAVAVLAALAVHAYLVRAGRSRPEVTVPVVTAARDIAAHTVVTAAMLTVDHLPPALLPPGAAGAVGAVAGAVTVHPVFAGQAVVAADLSRTATPAALSYAIAPGQRAFTLPVGPTSGVGEMIQPDDHVDVLALFTQGTDGLSETKVVTVAQDLLVLAVGQDIAGQPGPVPTTYSIVTLEVTPLQAATLDYAEARGQVQLTLRSVTDKARAPSPPVTGAMVWGR